MFLTPMWDGEPGKRPMFVITSDHGQGTGKSTTARWLSKVYGGRTYIDPNESKPSDLQRDLGTATEVPKRMVQIDNAVGEVDSPTYASMVTSAELNADRMYHGTFQPKNYKTFVMTANNASLSTDMAVRSVIIKLGSDPTKGTDRTRDIGTEVTEYIDDHREELVADIIAELRGTKRCDIPPPERDRWYSWTNGVLRLFDHGDELNRLVQSRRSDVDTETDRAKGVLDVLRDVLTTNGIDPEATNVCIPVSAMRDPLKEHWDTGRLGPQQLWNRLKEYFCLEPFRRYAIEKGKDSSGTQRGLLWRPQRDQGCLAWDKATNPDQPIMTRSTSTETDDDSDIEPTPGPASTINSVESEGEGQECAQNDAQPDGDTYECIHCGTEHDTVSDAMTCKCDDTDQSDGTGTRDIPSRSDDPPYRCPDCGDEYETFDGMASCICDLMEGLM